MYRVMTGCRIKEILVAALVPRFVMQNGFMDRKKDYWVLMNSMLHRLGFLNEFRVNMNYQDIEESRQQREYRRYDRFDSRIEKVKVWGFIVDGKKNMGNE